MGTADSVRQLVRVRASATGDGLNEADVIETLEMLGRPESAEGLWLALMGRGWEPSESWVDDALRALRRAGYLSCEGGLWLRSDKPAQSVRGAAVVWLLAPEPPRSRRLTPAPQRVAGYEYVWCRRSEQRIELSAHRHRGCLCGAGETH